jgi:protein-tyrosine phosphatase
MQIDKNKDGPFPNFRDLGGFVTRDGRQTRTGVYFRSGMPNRFGEEESAFLRRKGIRTVLDFRADEERERAGWNHKESCGIDYIRLPYYDRDSVSLLAKMERNQSFDWVRIYTGILDEGEEWIRSVFAALAVSKEAMLFYCASGKDRTGVIAALLLELLGAEDVWILTDYALTWYELEHNGSDFYQTSPETIKGFLCALRGRYGGAKCYLNRIGVPVSLSERIKKRLLI